VTVSLRIWRAPLRASVVLNVVPVSGRSPKSKATMTPASRLSSYSPAVRSSMTGVVAVCGLPSRVGSASESVSSSLPLSVLVKVLRPSRTNSTYQASEVLSSSNR
jgi:hypothetical protein